MRRWIAAFVLVLAGPGAVSAQAGVDVRIIPRAGVMTPADWFYVEYSHFGNPPLEWTEASLDKAPVLGLGVEVELPGTGVWLRGELVRSIDARMTMTHAVLFEPMGFEPARTERTPYTVTTALTSGTLDVAFPTLFRIGPVQPYVTAGAGGTHYAFETERFQELAESVVLPQPGSVWAANVGAGATVRAAGLLFDLQVRDAISLYWDRTQHNVMVLGGLSWEVFSR